MMDVSFPQYKYETIAVITDDNYKLPLYHVWSDDL
jgi:pimeloyl-ACP methyl ester carboxylesterase